MPEPRDADRLEPLSSSSGVTGDGGGRHHRTGMLGYACRLAGPSFLFLFFSLSVNNC